MADANTMCIVQVCGIYVVSQSLRYIRYGYYPSIHTDSHNDALVKNSTQGINTSHVWLLCTKFLETILILECMEFHFLFVLLNMENK